RAAELHAAQPVRVSCARAGLLSAYRCYPSEKPESLQRHLSHRAANARRESAIEIGEQAVRHRRLRGPATVVEGAGAAFRPEIECRTQALGVEAVAVVIRSTRSEHGRILRADVRVEP